MFRRFVTVLLVAALGASCASTVEPVEFALDDGGSSDAVTISDDPDSLATMTGRVALAAAQGEPHILWFWGAH